MRAWLLIGLAACSADIAPGAYFCGPEQLCPEGMTCNGVDNICTVPSQALAFECDFIDRQGDDTPETGLVLDDLTCVSGVREVRACLFDNDPGDWVQFDVPDNCNAVQIEARLTFPIAFEPVVLQHTTDGSAPSAVDSDCSVSTGDDAGRVSRCFEMTVENGSHHAVGLVHAGTENCDGNCAFNRATLSIQLSTP